MKTEIAIESLIQNFNRGNSTRAELKTLIAYFGEYEPGSELLSIYLKAWENAASETSLMNSEEEYSLIIKRINKKQLIPVSGRKRIIREFLKYAALFILAFAISWVVNNSVTQNGNKELSSSFQNIEVPYGSKTRIELPDGSHVTLNSGSRLRYQSNLGNDTRSVYLDGEAFFDVKKDASRPFYVNTSGIKIKVLGTSFNVKAYPEENTVETTLITGKVEIFKSGKKAGQIPMAVLVPGQKAIYEKETATVALKEREEEKPAPDNNAVEDNIDIKTGINTKLSVAWKDNEFVFDNERFGELIAKIERWYNVEIELDYPALKDARFSGKFDKETIEQAMKALTFVSPFHYEIEKNQIKITK